MLVTECIPHVPRSKEADKCDWFSYFARQKIFDHFLCQLLLLAHFSGICTFTFVPNEQSGLWPKIAKTVHLWSFHKTINRLSVNLNDFKFGQDVLHVAILSKFKMVRQSPIKHKCSIGDVENIFNIPD